MGSDRTRRRKQASRGDKPNPSTSSAFWGQGRWQTWLAAGVLIAAGLAAYANSFQGAFVYDDLESIDDNPHIRTLWPLSEAMSLALIEGGETVARRPLLSLSFALNYRLLGPEPWGYHLVNLGIHLVSALLLFGIVRRTLCLEPYRARWGDKAVPLALVVALLWEVHPLQTESVTYIVQRAESLMGMLYLLALYCSLRGFTSDRGRNWLVAAVAACAVGMGIKEVMATAPLVVFLYDGTFVSASYLDACRRRWKFYAALMATWSVMLLPLALGWQGASEDFTDRSPLAYALTQPGVILYYLRLSFWPTPLVMDYNWPTAEGWLSIIPVACVLVVLLCATVWGVFRRKWYGFVGAWFFLILGPSSSFVALNQNLEEHRMYLSLASVVVLTVAAGAWLMERCAPRLPSVRWVAAALALVLAIGLTAQTINRNRDYRSQAALWRQNIEHRPQSYIAHMNLGLMLFLEGKFDDAVTQYHQGLEQNPTHAPTWYNLGCALAAQRKFDDAARQLRKAISLSPNHVKAYTNLGAVLVDQGKPEEAEKHLRRALEIRPDYDKAHFNLGNALLKQGKSTEALEEYHQAVRLNPDYWQAHLMLGNLCLQQGQRTKAIDHLRRAVRLEPPGSGQSRTLLLQAMGN